MNILKVIFSKPKGRVVGWVSPWSIVKDNTGKLYYSGTMKVDRLQPHMRRSVTIRANTVLLYYYEDNLYADILLISKEDRKRGIPMVLDESRSCWYHQTKPMIPLEGIGCIPTEYRYRDLDAGDWF